MSAPDTNIEKQKEMHRSPMMGIKGAMIFGALMLVGVMFLAAMNGSEPSAETLIGTEQAADPSN